MCRATVSARADLNELVYSSERGSTGSNNLNSAIKFFEVAEAVDGWYNEFMTKELSPGLLMCYAHIVQFAR